MISPATVCALAWVSAFVDLYRPRWGVLLPAYADRPLFQQPTMGVRRCQSDQSKTSARPAFFVAGHSAAQKINLGGSHVGPVEGI